MEIPWVLLDRHFKGLLTDRDQEEFDIWVNRAAENQLLIDEIKSDLEKGLSFPGYFYSKKTTWQKIRNRINVSDPSTVLDSRIYRAVAAVAIPLLIVGFVGGWFSQKEVQLNADNLTYTVIISPKGQRTQVVLPDNSKVWLNSNTTIKYPSTFNQKDRRVDIDGEAFFDVTHDQEKPFIVNTSSFNIKVYGTSFNVCAYKSDNTIETTLVKGKISIEGLNVKGQKAHEIILVPNESFKYVKNEQLVESEMKKELNKLTATSAKTKNIATTISKDPILSQIIVARNVNVEPIIGWKEGKLFFDNETFESLSTKFERRYDVKIYFEDKKVANLKYTGVFEKENINQALDALKLTTSFEYKMNLKEIYISYRK